MSIAKYIPDAIGRLLRLSNETKGRVSNLKDGIEVRIKFSDMLHNALEYTYNLSIAKIDMSKRDQKRLRGVPLDWDEVKKRRNLILTDTAWRLLQERADEFGISRSELVERLIRGLISIDAEKNDENQL